MAAINKLSFSSSSSSSSSSSIPSMKSNPSARNSESRDPMRRSFTGSPFAKPSSIVANSKDGFNPNTPANSPSDFTRRSSFGRENQCSLGGDYEDKENSKGLNLRPGRVQSPASVSKGTKNFMSPTISAASKFTASPRKKILIDRNEPLPSSVQFSEAKGQVKEDNNVKPEINFTKKKTVTFSDAIELLIEDDLSNPEMGFKEEKIEASYDTTITDKGNNEALIERNEPLRSSVQFSEAKGQVKEDNNVKPEITFTKKKTVSFSDAIDFLIEDDLSNPEMGFKEEKIEASYDTTITDKGHNEALTSDSGCYSEEPLELTNDLGSSCETDIDCVNLHPTFKISPKTSSTTSPMLAPLDADPLMPPYDPKTNYLSPRPQFLHYRPNPRIELVHEKDRDGKRLKVSFILENLSDSEASESLSEDSPKESEDVSSDERVKEEEASVKKEEELKVSKTSPISTHKPKSKLFTRLMFTALLLALVLTCLSISVSDSSVTDLSMLKDVAFSNLYVPSEITEFARVKFEELVQKSMLWVSNSLSYACKLISEFRGVHKHGPLQYGNLTSFPKENQLVEGYTKFGHTDAGAESKCQEYVLAPIRERDGRGEPLAESLPETEDNEEDIEEVLEEEDGGEFEEKVHQVIDEVHAYIDEVEGYTKFGHTDAGAESKCQDYVLAPIRERDGRGEPLAESLPETEDNEEDIEEVLEEEDGGEFEEKVHQVEVHAYIDEVVEDQAEAESEDVVHARIDEVVEDHTEAESEVSCATPPAEESESVNSEADHSKETSVEGYVDKVSKPQSNINAADQTVEILDGTEIQTQVEHDMSKKAKENSQNTELDASVVNTPQASAIVDNFLTKNVVGISSIVLLGMLAVIAFGIQKKKAKLTNPSVTAPAVQSVMTKKLDYSPISISAGHTLQQKLAAASRNWQTEDDNAFFRDKFLGESCPSETSSLKSSSHKEATSEAQSQKSRRNHYKRESVASSDISLSSYSYGSFTTYEKIPSKHASNDEVVTPVRRSSRIRKQVTSP